jgi:hypothetical protein
MGNRVLDVVLLIGIRQATAKYAVGSLLGDGETKILITIKKTRNHI